MAAALSFVPCGFTFPVSIFLQSDDHLNQLFLETAATTDYPEVGSPEDSDSEQRARVLIEKKSVVNLVEAFA